MRRVVFLGVQTLADHERRYEARHARVDMHHGAAREIEHAGIGEETVRMPDPMRDRRIDDQRPKPHEHQHRGEFDSVTKCARDQRGRDDRESHLEHHIKRFWNGHRRGRCRAGAKRERRVHIHPAQQHAAEIADVSIAVGEGEAVADDDPQHGDQARRCKTLHDGRQHIVPPHHAAIEHREAGNGHQQHERRRGQHPGGIAAIDRGRIGRQRDGGQQKSGEEQGQEALHIFSLRERWGGGQTVESTLLLQMLHGSICRSRRLSESG